MVRMTMTSLDADPSVRGPGRPREFDIDEALDRAIEVFALRGYQAASIAELKAAMQLTSGSLYKAFKDKRAIFLAAFDRYKTVRDALLTQQLESGTSGRDRLRIMVSFYAEASHGASGRRGCLVVGSATELAIFDTDMAALVAAATLRNEARIVGMIHEGQVDGSVRADLDSAATARALLCLMQGLRIIGKTGCDRALTLSVVDAAMKLVD